MPVWHELTKEARQNGDLVLLGVIQEQHPDRCRLFAQWQQLDWTILHDPINRVKARAVPMFIAIDEAGRVVDANLTADEYAAFIARPTAESSKSNEPNSLAAREQPQPPDTFSNSPESWEALADHQILWGRPEDVTGAIGHYQKSIELSSQNASAHFSMGVAYRMRFDSSQAVKGDFQAAIDAWGTALAIDPNHYIYRRRIQQYGPRLTKPYPFYDWVEQAQQAILQRGQTPIQLSVQPSGAEIAEPSQTFDGSDQLISEPDPEGRINRDTRHLIDASAVVVPGKIEPGDVARIHIQLRPFATAHWNNEAEPLRLWIDAPAGWQIERPLLQAPQPSSPETSESRDLEFEIRSPAELASRETGTATLSAYALFYVCEEVGGQCLYLRKDIRIPIAFVHGQETDTK